MTYISFAAFSLCLLQVSRIRTKEYTYILFRLSENRRPFGQRRVISHHRWVRRVFPVVQQEMKACTGRVLWKPLVTFSTPGTNAMANNYLSMIEVHPRLFIGTELDYESQVRLREGWWVVHACKEPYHRQLLV